MNNSPIAELTVLSSPYLGAPSLSGEATIHIIINDINDHAPTFDLPILSANVVENEPRGQNVIRVTASDRDSGLNADVRYALMNDSNADSFHINPINGP